MKESNIDNLPGREHESEGRKVATISPHRGDDLLVSRKIDRNAPCPCGSGKKAKHCCGTETKYYSAKAAK